MALAEKLLSGGGLVFAALGALGWQYFAREPAAHVGVEIDSSGSVNGNCKGLRERTQTLLTAPGVREGSTLSVLVIGSDAASEPTLVLSEPIPAPPADVTGRKRKEEAFHQAETRLLDHVEQVCATAKESQGSPVLQMVKRGLAQLRSLGCSPKARCYLLIKTDAIEGADPRLRSLIERSARKPSIAIPADLAGALNTVGITATFCGTAEAGGRRIGRDPAPETVERIWKALFNSPGNVTFEPYCGR